MVSANFDSPWPSARDLQLPSWTSPDLEILVRDDSSRSTVGLDAAIIQFQLCIKEAKTLSASYLPSNIHYDLDAMQPKWFIEVKNVCYS